MSPLVENSPLIDSVNDDGGRENFKTSKIIPEKSSERPPLEMNAPLENPLRTMVVHCTPFKEDPLIVSVALVPNSSGFYGCMIDSGAGISLISTEITESYMKNLPLRPSVDIKVNAISGLVREHSVPIDFYIECNLYLSLIHISEPTRLLS